MWQMSAHRQMKPRHFDGTRCNMRQKAAFPLARRQGRLRAGSEGESMRHIITAACLCLAATAARAQEAMTWTVEDEFDNVTFAIESAITDQGLVIDMVSHTGEMLERTRPDVGSDVVLFTQADIFSFCSSKISRQVMEADVTNVQFCPYTIFVYERPEEPGKIVVGHRNYPGESMAAVNHLLSGIVRRALGVE